MKIKNKLLIALLALNNLGIVSAEQTVTQKTELYELQLKYNNLIKNNEINNSLYEKRTVRKYTVPNELPESAGTPNYKINAESGRDEYTITFWRAQLTPGEYVPLVKIEPMSNDGVFICSIKFSVIQNGKQFDDISLHSGDDDSYCGTLFVGKTLIFDQRRYTEERFDAQGAFTIIIDEYEIYRFEIPALSGESHIPAPINKPATVNENLNIHIPTASFGTLNIWADLEYKGIDSNNEYIWRLKNYGVNK